jgi:nicotinamide-nucleotide amidase
MLPDLIRRGRQPTVGITVSQATISLRITAEGETSEACYAVMEPTIQTIHECLGDLVFGEEEDELQDVIVRMLSERAQTLAIAEWNTGGLIANWLSDAQGDRHIFKGGLILGDDANSCLLNSLDIAQGSSSLVEETAAFSRRQFQADFALVVGPTSSTDVNEPSKFQCAVAVPEKVISKVFQIGGHPSIVKARSAKQSLDFLRKTIAEFN